jgi:hypothetical protein
VYSDFRTLVATGSAPWRAADPAAPPF